MLEKYDAMNLQNISSVSVSSGGG